MLEFSLKVFLVAQLDTEIFDLKTLLPPLLVRFWIAKLSFDEQSQHQYSASYFA